MKGERVSNDVPSDQKSQRSGYISNRIRRRSYKRSVQFTASFRGKYNVLVDKTGEDRYWLKLSDEEGREMLFFTSEEDYSVVRVFEAARRAALNVDGVIDEILGE